MNLSARIRCEWTHKNANGLANIEPGSHYLRIEQCLFLRLKREDFETRNTAKLIKIARQDGMSLTSSQERIYGSG